MAVKIVVAGEVNLKQLDRARTQLQQLEREAAKSAGGMKGAFYKMQDGARSMAAGYTAMAATVAVAGAAVWQSVQAYAEAESVQISLERAINNTGESYAMHDAQVQKLISSSSQLAAVDDELVSTAFARLVQATGSVTEAQKYLGLTLDLSRAKGKDVVQTATVIGKAYNGNVGALTRYGVIVEKGASATQALGEAQKKYAGYAEDYGRSAAGASDRLAVAFGNLTESAGEFALKGLGLEVSMTRLSMLMDHAANGEWKEFFWATDQEVEVLNRLAGKTDETATSTRDFTATVEEGTDEVVQYTRSLDGLKTEVGSLDDKMRGAKDAELDWRQAVLDAADAHAAVNKLRKEGKTKTDEYKRAVIALERADLRLADATNIAKEKQQEANAAFVTSKGGMEKLGRGAVTMSNELDRATDRVIDLKTQLNTVPANKRAKVEADIKEAEANVRRIRGQIASLSNKVIKLRVEFSGSGSVQRVVVDGKLTGLRVNAAGGWYNRATAALVGEASPRLGEYVINADRAARGDRRQLGLIDSLMSSIGAGGGITVAPGAVSISVGAGASTSTGEIRAIVNDAFAELAQAIRRKG